MFPSPCSGFVPVASRGSGQPSVWSGNMSGSIRADAVTTDRNIVPGSGIDIVLCEVCNTPSLASRLASCCLWRAEGDAERAHGSRTNRPAQTARRRCPRCMTCKRSPSLWMNAEPVPTGWRPLRVLTRHASRCRLGSCVFSCSDSDSGSRSSLRSLASS